MMYLTLKYIHVSCAVLSVVGFAVRGFGWVGAHSWVTQRWIRIAPHLVDSVFLLSGLAMALMLRLGPLANPWLGAKLLGLIAYVALGMVASRAPRRGMRLTAYLLALVAFAYVVSVALSKSPSGLLTPG